MRARGHDELDDDPILRSKYLAEECTQHPSLRPRGYDELDDHDYDGDEDAYEDSEHATDDEVDGSEHTEFELAQMWMFYGTWKVKGEK